VKLGERFDLAEAMRKLEENRVHLKEHPDTRISQVGILRFLDNYEAALREIARLRRLLREKK
jgi:hypothetical protein